MAYTRPWDPPNMLLGSRDADEIDDAVRDFARDLDERMVDFMIDPTADPVQLKTVNVTERMHWSAGDVETDGATRVHNAIYPATTTDFVIVRIPLILGVGSIIREVTARIMRVTAMTFTFDLIKIDAAGVASAVFTSIVPPTDPGIQDVSSGALNETVDADTTYFIMVSIIADATPSNGRLFSVTWNGDRVWGS